MTDDPAATIRHLRAELRRALEDAHDLRARLAEEQIRTLRARVVGKVNQAAAPRGSMRQIEPC